MVRHSNPNYSSWVVCIVYVIPIAIDMNVYKSSLRYKGPDEEIFLDAKEKVKNRALLRTHKHKGHRSLKYISGCLRLVVRVRELAGVTAKWYEVSLCGDENVLK